MRCSYYYTLIDSHQFPHLCCLDHNILVHFPKAFFLSEFLRWDVLTIVHWFIPTSFLIFVVFITTFWSISLRPSFYLNFSDEGFLLLYIDSFPPVSSSLLSLSQHFGPFPYGLLSIWISQMRCSYYYTLIHSHQFPHLCCLYHNILVPLPWGLLSIRISQMRCSYYYTLIHSHQFPHFCCLYHNILLPLPWGVLSIWNSQMRCSYYYTLIHSHQFPHLCCLYHNILVHFPEAFFLSEFLRWDVLTIIHWFIPTSFLIFVVFITTFWSLYPEAFFLCEFLKWDVLTIIHWLIPTSFLIFVVFITIFWSLYPEVFFLSEFLRWDVLTIIHWFIPTSFLIFVVFITTFWSLYS